MSIVRNQSDEFLPTSRNLRVGKGSVLVKITRGQLKRRRVLFSTKKKQKPLDRWGKFSLD